MAENDFRTKTADCPSKEKYKIDRTRQRFQLSEPSPISNSGKSDQKRDQVDQLGIIYLPPGCRGLRSLYLHRENASFGFTLRHFILYSPESLSTYNDHLSSSNVTDEPLETIFVKDITRNGAAERAGLRTGDRLVAVNGTNLKNYTYAQVVQMIKNAPDYIHLLVISKDDDILQKYYGKTVYCPETNRRPGVKRSQRKLRRTSDTILNSTWDPNYYNHNSNSRQSYKTDNEHLYSYIKGDDQHIYSEVKARPRLHFDQDPRNRRKSDCSQEFDSYSSLPPIKFNHQNMSILNSAGCRLSLDADSTSSSLLSDQRRESSSSSIADSGCKETSSSIDSISTLTNYDVDDSQRISRLKRDFERKKEFLRQLPVQNISWPASSSNNSSITSSHENFLIVPKEFYSRPHRIQKENLVWPPHLEETTTNLNPDTTHRVLGHQNRLVGQQQQQQKLQSHDEETLNSNSRCDNDKQNVLLPNLQYVSKITHQFENVQENDSMNDKTNFYRSELARLSAKRPNPNVADRRHEFETLLSSQNQKSQSDPKDCIAANRLSKSSDFNESQQTTDHNDISNSNLSGNRMVIIGNKNVHCESPADSKKSPSIEGDLDEKNHEAADKMDCSTVTLNQNLTDSYLKQTGLNAKSDIVPSHHYFDHYHQQHDKSQQPVLLSPTNLTQQPLISITPASDAPNAQTSTNIVPPQRPNYLALKSPIRLSPSKSAHSDDIPEDDDLLSTVSANETNIPVVVRRNKNTNHNEDRATRRISYLKATWGDRINIDSDLDFSDSEYSPKSSKKSTYRSWRPPLFLNDIQQLKKIFEDITSASSGSSTKSSSKDKELNELVSREGHLQCKVLGFDGKKANDRSWKQVWVVLQGPYLSFYKDRHYQSPMGLNEMESSSLSYSQIDMRCSAVSVAEDYTKRKNVIRIMASKPYRSELLLQADTTADMADWIRSFNEQVVTTKEDAKLKPDAVSENQRLKVTSCRTRSPSGQSPVSKSRKSCDVTSSDPQHLISSPKPKNWRNRMVKQFRKMQQGSSTPNSPTTTPSTIVEGSFGVPLELCVPSSVYEFVPKVVEICTDLVEQKGLEVTGIYRVPGNNAAVSYLTECINKGADQFNLEDPRWNDMNVVGSLLKSFFRKLPDSLFTFELYSALIEADKDSNHYNRLIEVRKLINELPIHNFETLKVLMRHLKKVVKHSDVNKMESRNISIVFGPTLVRNAECDMFTMVTDMSHQCHIVESLILYESEFGIPPEPVATAVISDNEPAMVENHTLLLENIRKVENLKTDNHKKDIVSSIISAANRKMQRKSRKSSSSELKSDSMNSVNNSCSSTELLDNCCSPYLPDSLTLAKDSKMHNKDIGEFGTSTGSGSSADSLQVQGTDNNGLIMSYANLSATTQERIRKFEQETKAQLSRQRILNLRDNNHHLKLSEKDDNSVVNKNDLNSMKNCLKSNNGIVADNRNGCYSTSVNNCDGRHSIDECDSSSTKKLSHFNQNNIVQYSNDINSNNALDDDFLKRVKTAKNSDTKVIKQKSGSLDSLNKITLADCKRSSLELSDEGSDLVHQITMTFDNKLKSLQAATKPTFSHCVLPESHRKLVATITTTGSRTNNRDKVPNLSSMQKPNASPKLFRNPSLHKNFEVTITSMKLKVSKDETKVPEKNVLSNTIATDKLQTNNSKVKRSESLNKAASNLFNSIKVRRSESLNKSDKVIEKLKKFDNLFSKSKKNSTMSSKFRKRANAKSIKRRHTVGGTKDFDNVQWLEKNPQNKVTRIDVDVEDQVCYLDENCDLNNIDKGLRSSSPDLSNSKQGSANKILYDVQDDLIALLKQHFSKPISSERTPIQIA